MQLKKPAEVLLMGPGPSPVHPRILEALGRHTLGHLDPEFLEIMNQTSDLLRYVFETENQITFPVSGTGSAGMEAALVNILEPGDKAVVGVNGVFGQRMVDVASRCGAEVIEVESEWGGPVDLEAMEKTLFANPGVKLVGVVHAETSTGARQPLEPVVELAHNRDALVLVDAVTSLGGLPVEVDRQQLDIVYSGNQKCLGAPPGLAPITFNERALQKFRNRKTKVQSWYLDLSFLTRYWGEERFYHHTAPVNMIYALFEALSIIKEEGLEDRFARHLLHSSALVAGLRALGVKPVVSEKHRLPSLIAAWIPENLKDSDVRSRLRQEYLIEIGGGLGPFKGKVWRIGLMGNGSKRENVERLLKALGEIFNSLGQKCSYEEALKEADKFYQQQI
ncbi:MAG: alanine--glyoxylate aminotransferase family protein [Bacillota bacterium]